MTDSTNTAIFPSNMASKNVSNKQRNELTIALKFLHEARLNISFQFDGNKNAGRVSLNPPINFRAILLATLRHVVQNHRTVITQ